MARLVCGRCGNLTAPNSTYCTHDRWVIVVDQPSPEAGAPIDFEVPGGIGFLARRKQEGHRDSLERSYRHNIERRLDALEKRLSAEPENPEVLRAMGLLTLLENQLERSNALLERAHAAFRGEDFETSVNYAIVLARRGQLQPAIEILGQARQKWVGTPIVLLNLALVALQARRPSLVHEAVSELEQLWIANPAIAQDFHDEGVTARGLALLLEDKPREALTQLESAVSHTVHVHRPDTGQQNLGDGMQIERSAEAHEEVPDDIVLEGKAAEADALNNLALAEAALGSLDKASARLRSALRIEPGHPQVLNNLGVLAYRQNRLDVAYKYLDTARQVEEFLDYVDPTTWNHLGVVLSAQGQLDAGLEHFQRAGGVEHAEFEVFYNLGRAFIQHGKADVGVNYLRQAFSIEPNNADVHTVLGAAYLYAGRTNLYGEAMKHLKRAIQIDSHHKTAAADLILSLFEIHNTDAGRQLLLQALKLFPSEAEPRFLAGLLLLEDIENSPNQEQVWARAAQSFEVALNARPDLTACLYNSALCQFMMGFRDTSAKLLEAALARDSSLGPAYYLIGLGHAIGKRETEALAAWKIAAQFESNNPDLHANIGALLYRKGDLQGSIRSYMTAHRLLPQDANILSAMGVVFAQAKLYSQAITALEQSLQIEPRSALTHSNIGLANYLFTRVEKAMEHWRMVSRIDARYAAEREEEQQRSFDDSIVQLRPINWRERVVRMSPVLPRPRTRLLPGTNARQYRPAVTDPALQEIVKAKREVERASRMLAWMSLRS